MRFTESVCNSWLCNLSLNVCPVDDMSDCLNRVDASRAVTVGGRVPKPKIAYVHPRGAEAPTAPVPFRGLVCGFLPRVNNELDPCLDLLV